MEFSEIDLDLFKTLSLRTLKPLRKQLKIKDQNKGLTEFFFFVDKNSIPKTMVLEGKPKIYSNLPIEMENKKIRLSKFLKVVDKDIICCFTAKKSNIYMYCYNIVSKKIISSVHLPGYSGSIPKKVEIFHNGNKSCLICFFIGQKFNYIPVFKNRKEKSYSDSYISFDINPFSRIKVLEFHIISSSRMILLYKLKLFCTFAIYDFKNNKFIKSFTSPHNIEFFSDYKNDSITKFGNFENICFIASETLKYIGIFSFFNCDIIYRKKITKEGRIIKLLSLRNNIFIFYLHKKTIDIEIYQSYSNQFYLVQTLTTKNLSPPSRPRRPGSLNHPIQNIPQIELLKNNDIIIIQGKSNSHHFSIFENFFYHLNSSILLKKEEKEIQRNLKLSHQGTKFCDLKITTDF